MYNWDLNKIYNGVNSKEFKNDLKKTKELVEAFNSFDYSTKNSTEVFKRAFIMMEELDKLFTSLYEYLSLRLSINLNTSTS